MRIVLIVSRFPSTSETFVVRLFLGLLERGWDVHVCASSVSSVGSNSYPQLQRLDAWHRVHMLPDARSRAWMLFAFPWLLLRTSLAAPKHTWRYLRGGWRRLGVRVVGSFYRDAALVALAPDVVHFQFGADAIGRESLTELVEAAIVVTFQGYDLSYHGLEEEPGFYAELWRRADAVHFLSEALARTARERGFSRAELGHVVPHAVDHAFFDGRAQSHEENAGNAGRPLRVLSVGRLHWVKGYEYALEAIDLLRRSGVVSEYRIVGDGDARQAVTFTIHDLGLDEVVSLLGHLDEESVREQMRWADVLLHPSVTEGCGVAVLEAQAMQLPIVASDAGGLPEIVSNEETGFVVPRRDAQALVKKLASLAGDAPLRDRMGRAGRERAIALFDHGAFVRKIEDLYRDAVARRCRADTG